MKYIRTETGIYEVNEIKPYFLDETQKLFIINELKAGFLEKDIIAQADTIKDLCDEFVVVNLEKNTYFVYDNTKSDWTLETYAGSPSHFVYGAIYTYKGLIYVAKMNDNGEFELI